MVAYDKLSKDMYTAFQNRRVAISVAAFFGILVIYSLVRFVIDFIPPGTPKALRTQQQLVVKTLPAIANWHIFGNYQQTQADLLPKTRLQLTLEGVFYASETAKSQALIAEPGQAARLYSVGQQLPGGTIVHQILQDGVVLEQNGNLELLPLPLPKLNFAPRPKDTLGGQRPNL